MKSLVCSIALSFLTVSAFAQNETEPTPITPVNSWLKVGANGGIPIGNFGDHYNAFVGIELNGQFMSTRHLGLGVASGYTHYFSKKSQPTDTMSYGDFGAIPVGFLLRYYPKAKGIYMGVDAGFTFVPEDLKRGGFYVRPQVGYHNRNWNFYAFYNHVFNNKNYNDLQGIGVAVVYNLRFKR